MAEKKIVMIDQDEVISKGGLLLAINEFLKANYPEEYFNHFYMQSVIPESRKNEFFYDYLPSFNLYERCILMPDSVETIMALEESGIYKPFIVTDWMFPEIKRDCGWNLHNKHDYLSKTIPLDPSRFVFVGDKSIIMANVRIDDKLINLTNALYPAEIKLLYAAYHNAEMTDDYLKPYGAQRVENWLEIKRKLLP